MHAFWSLRKDPRKHTWQLSGIFFGIFRHLLWIVWHLFWDCQAICLGSTAYFHWLGPLGRVSHRVAMSVCMYVCMLSVCPLTVIFFLYCCYYPHTSRESVCPVCGILFIICNVDNWQLIIHNTKTAKQLLKPMKTVNIYPNAFLEQIVKARN